MEWMIFAVLAIGAVLFAVRAYMLYKSRERAEQERAEEDERKRAEIQAKAAADRAAFERRRALLREEEAREKAEEEKARLERRAAVIKAKQDAFLAELDRIARYDISYSTTKYAKRAMAGFPDISFSNVTRKNSTASLGQFVVIDIETTGLSLRSKIVEISAMRFEDYEPVEVFTTLVNPEIPIPAEVSAINQITDDMVAAAPKIWEVMPALQEFVGSSNLIGHNLSFDLKFLYIYGLEFGQKTQRFYDTLQLARYVLCEGRTDNYKLPTLCGYYGIPLAKAHRAAADCLATGKLFAKLVEDKIGE